LFYGCSGADGCNVDAMVVEVLIAMMVDKVVLMVMDG
jgi:hypothetical protein